MERSNFTCKTCSKTFIGLSFFYNHLENNHHLSFQCPFTVCLRQYSTIRSLQTHLSRDHQLDKPFLAADKTLSIKCPVKSCGLTIGSRQEYLKHMPPHFAEGQVFHCAYPNCETFLGTVGSFRTHVAAAHPLTFRKLLIPKKETSDDLADVSDDSSNESVQDSQNTVNPPQASQVGKEMFEPQSQENNQDEDPYAEFKVKDQLGKFYLSLEGEYLLPTSTVQVIAEEIALITKFSHHHLERSLKPQLQEAGLDENTISRIIANTFMSDPVYNTHHKKKDSEQFCTDYLRQKYWKKNYPYVEPQQVYLGEDETGGKKYAQYVSIRESVKSMLKDPIVKRKVLESFTSAPKECPPTVLSDFTDGSAFINHRKTHHGGKCIFINLFQDGCDYNAFGPSVGKYKPNNFYFSLGNLTSEHRTTSSTINLAYVILEKHLKNSEGEELQDVDKLKVVLKPLLEELEDLKINGIEIDGEVVPVCLLFLQGDNLGQHFIGGFVCSFSCEHCCRFCEITLTEFRADPTTSKPLRTPEEYDQSVLLAKRSWTLFRDKCLDSVSQRNQRLLDNIRAPGSKFRIKRILAKSTFDKLKGIHHKGVKYRPSPFNSEKLQFHCCSPSLAPCISHDLWEGSAKNMLPKILSTFVEKKWFDLDTLNRRIESFSYEGTDKADAPTRLKSLTSLGGNATENSNLVRLLPLIIGDLIQDKDDEMWSLYLKFKVIAEYVCAPKITVKQVAYLRSLIAEYLLEVKRLLPECLYPKQHLLSHAPELIMIFGPLTKLFTLRFESYHVFFKKVANSSRNFINFTHTLARKYMCKFALDHSSNLLEEEVLYDYYNTSPVLETEINDNMKHLIPESVFTESFRVATSVSVKGTQYNSDLYMVIDCEEGCDLKVGKIEIIFLNTSSKEVFFLLNVKPAVNTFQGFFKIHTPAVSYQFENLNSLPDYYPLPSYNVQGHHCLTLKHSMIKM
ncbi:Zinc finger protein ZXDC [Frankliniella fusca]|uniref:Zinc finger protein ZXDC n=1 Tax=Frankliniella fusca TaxID=407009 RepID=A0AAE1HHX1_9NEOP|nr:Zinc finger protein ZXDC [Frankliniella fusca]